MSFQNSKDVAEALRSGPLPSRDLHLAWSLRQSIPWAGDLDVASRFIEQLVVQQEFLLAIDAAREIVGGRQEGPEVDQGGLVGVRLGLARALVRLGQWDDARRQCVIARKQLDRGADDAQLRLQLVMGELYREQCFAAMTRAEQLKFALRALVYYESALALDARRPDALLLAASLSLMLGQRDPRRIAAASEQARVVLSLADDREKRAEGPDVTRYRAAAHVILGDPDTAARYYQQLEGEGASTAFLADARHEAAFLADATGHGRDRFRPAFPPLQLIAFAGHLPDRQGDPVRFPSSSIEQVRDAIRAKLTELKARAGLVSAAAGADLLFIEELCQLRHDCAVHLVLPWSQEEFRRTSVRPFEAAGTPYWEPRFDEALQRAATVREIGQVYEPGSDAGWQYSVEVTAGIAMHMARAAHLDVLPMALWDGRPGRGVGGTGSFVAFWDQHMGREPVVIGMPMVAAAERERHVSTRVERPILQQGVKSILFADIVGYSKLTERVIPEFVVSFLGRVSALVASSRHAPMHMNTWGDALFAVFDFTHDAALFALELTRLVTDSHDEWIAKGLYRSQTDPLTGKTGQVTLSLRIALHAGPVLMHFEPVTRHLGFTGAHVTRAARMEPVGEAGRVIASEEFAALVEVDEAARRRDGKPIEFVCQYAGSMPLGKDYPGHHRIYRVEARRDVMIETLAVAIHEAYRALTGQLGPWAELPEDLRDANRAQAAHTAQKLRVLGWELTESAGESAGNLVITPEQLEQLAIAEHDRWMIERQLMGWSYAPVRDNARKHHPLLVPWDLLSESEKDKDRNVIRTLPGVIDQAGLRVRRI